MTLKEYQNYIKNKLGVIFPSEEILVDKSLKMRKYNIYSPRLDVIVGPFAISNSLIYQYDEMANNHRPFIEGLINKHNENISNYDSSITLINYNDVINFNRNSRCFIAIEIENEVSRKHLVGGAINASSLGRIGLFVGWSEEKFQAMLRLNGYFNFLKSVEKNTYDLSNLLIFNKDQLKNYFDDFFD